MSTEITTAIMALAGTLVGGGITLLGQLQINKQQAKREYIKLATDLGNQERLRLMANSKDGGNFHPVESFITYYLKYFDLMNEKELDVKKLKDLEDFRLKIYTFYESYQAPLVSVNRPDKG